MEGVTGVAKHFKNDNNKSIGTSNLFYVKLKSLADTVTLKQIAIEKKVSIHHQLEYIPEWFALHRNIHTPSDVVELSNQFFETQLFETVDPNFLFEIAIVEPGPEPCLFGGSNSNCASDEQFGNQWGLFNEENPNTDINMCEAWGISTRANTKIAIIDTGVQLDHTDLMNNITPQSFDANTNTSPSQVYTFHGTFVAGICGASNNNNGIAGVAPNTKIISVSHPLNGQQSDLTKCAKMGGGIWWAKDNNANIINNSWGIQTTNFSSSVLEDYITDVTNNGRGGKGCIVVFAAGNDGGTMRYPANNPNLNLLTVGASRPDGLKATFSSHGPTLDIVAPGVCVPSTTIGSLTTQDDGTSFAAPHVAGVAALMLSVNPCLTRQQVYDIIEQTAQKLSPAIYAYTTTPNKPNGTWNNKVGYGLLDAFAAVQMAQSMGSADLDLMVKDSQDDTGVEPNTVTQYMWTSDNIWVRNNNDSGLTHENPDYSANGNPNYVKVRVINKSCVSSTGSEQLKLYWAKASTGLSWPNPWNGGISEPITNASMGQQIGTLTIPILQAGQEAILTFPWQVPNPANYSQDQWHFCLLTRIEATNEPMTFLETGDLNTNVRNNNNIAWKNVTVVDILPNNIVNPGGVVAVGNPFNHPKTFFLEMEIADLETGKPIFQEAEVGIKMDDILFQAWERGGKEAQLLDPTLEEKRKIVRGNHVILDNIAFNANETGTLRLDFNFLTKELTDKTNYAYHVIQKDAETGQVIGGETFIINKNPRPIFVAEAPNQEVDLNQAITISAEDINEPAIYNWYDSEGNLVYQGKNLQIANAISEKFKLEVISTVDGFKDYTEVEVTLKPSTLENIVPNPATNNVLISYKLNGVNSAYLMVIGYYGSNGTSNNYILDVNSSETNLNVSSYPSGFYTVALVVNGEIVDAKTLIKQ